MVVLSSLLCVRLVTSSGLRFLKPTICTRTAWLSTSIQRSYTSGSTNSSVGHLNSGPERYKDLQRYFSRRLKAIYHRFSNIPDHSVVCGQHHVYFFERDSIYRTDKRLSEPDPEQVLNLGHVSRGNEKAGLENEARKQIFQWTIQRIRLSPQEKHFAAMLKTNHREELRCVVVKLERRNSSPLDPSPIILTLDNVFSFEWASDDVLFYTTLEGQRCSRVFHLDLTSTDARIRLVYEETRPE